MKYEVPEINISKFSVENIVTESAITVAEGIVNEALGTATNQQIVKTSLNDWIEVQ